MTDRAKGWGRWCFTGKRISWPGLTEQRGITWKPPVKPHWLLLMMERWCVTGMVCWLNLIHVTIPVTAHCVSRDLTYFTSERRNTCDERRAEASCAHSSFNSTPAISSSVLITCARTHFVRVTRATTLKILGFNRKSIPWTDERSYVRPG